VAEINRLMAANGPKVDTIVDNVVEVTAEATGPHRRLPPHAKLIMADVKAVTNEVSSIVGKNSGNVEEGFRERQGRRRPPADAMDKLDGTLDRTQSIATKIDNGQGTIGRLVNDDKLINSVTDVVDESSRFIKKITRLQTIVALRSEYYLGETAVKNYFSLKLQPKPDKYYMLQLIDDPRGARCSARRSRAPRLDQESRHPRAADHHRGPLPLLAAVRQAVLLRHRPHRHHREHRRVGLDVHLLDDDLELSADIFAFDENVNPRLKLWGLYTFFTHLYVAAGIDDVLERRGDRLLHRRWHLLQRRGPESPDHHHRRPEPLKSTRSIDIRGLPP
jgi:phospholipid/cholesterol/gamma-HCH transport system substrate-binding protein